ncbi:hypothetical protein [Burkholderia gladioli]|uniref:hypothetical protein n=1 Tax=Burkholderia gladioli TaxID=28095 RepID=UPI0034DAC834
MTDTTYQFKFLGELYAQQLICELALSRLATGPASIRDVMKEAFESVRALDQVLATSSQARAKRSVGEKADACETRQSGAATYCAGFTTPEEEIRRRVGVASDAGTPATQFRST